MPKTKLPIPEEMETTAEELKDIFGDEKILLCPVLFGGSKLAEPYEVALNEMGVNYERHDIKQEDTLEKGEYRPISTDAKDIGARHGARTLVLYDDDIHFGHSAAGALVWALENQNILGINRVFLNVDLDYVGGANVARVKRYREYMGPKKLLEDVSPGKFSELESQEKTGIISTYKPEFDASAVEQLMRRELNGSWLNSIWRCLGLTQKTALDDRQKTIVRYVDKLGGRILERLSRCKYRKVALYAVGEESTPFIEAAIAVLDSEGMQAIPHYLQVKKGKGRTTVSGFKEKDMAGSGVVVLANEYDDDIFRAVQGNLKRMSSRQPIEAFYTTAKNPNIYTIRTKRH